MADGRNDRSRKFQPANNRFQPKGRQNLHHRSLMNLTASVVNETTSNVSCARIEKTENKEAGFVRKIPKFFRWGVGKKILPLEPIPKVVSDPTENTPKSSVPAERGFVGNLGIGHYITSDESAFLNYDIPDENTAPVNHKGFSKSMVDLSSITPWSCTPTEPTLLRSSHNHSMTESEAESMSTSSHSDFPGVLNTLLKSHELRAPHTECNQSVPDLIKVLFFTNLPCDTSCIGKDTLTSSRDSGTEQRNMVENESISENLPAWLITENDLTANVPYTMFRTRDYLGEICKAIRWLEENEQRSGKHKKSSRRFQSPVGLRFASDLRSRRLPFDTSNVAVKKKRIPTDEPTHSDDVSVTATPAPFINPKEGKIMLKMLSEASRIIESMNLYSEGTRSYYSGLNAWIIRSVAMDCNCNELNGRMLIPDLQRSTSSRDHTAQEMKQVFRQDTAQIYQIVSENGEAPLVSHESKFRETTLYLTSSHLLIASTSPGSQTICLTQFQHVLPLCQLWCSKITLDGENESILINEGQNVILTADMTVHAPVSLNSSSLTESEETVGVSSVVGDATSSFGCMQTFVLGSSLTENWLLRFPDKVKMERWSAYLHDAISYNQRTLIGRTLYIKMMNQVADNQVVYKYQKVYLTTSVKELKESAMDSMNINRKTDVQIWVRYSNVEGNQKEVMLRGYESPFLIALLLTLNYNEHSTVRSPTSVPASHGKIVDLFDQFKRSNAESCEPMSKVWKMEHFLAQLPDTNPLFPRDQVRAEFFLRGKEQPAMLPKKQRIHGVMRPSDVKKSHSHFHSTKAHREKGSLLDKTNSTLLLPTDGPKAARTGGALRGARSTGCLNTTAEHWAIFGHIPEKIWPSAVLPQSLVVCFKWYILANLHSVTYL
ncbi:unnamed protein product [Dicrocoelium dendriticum]|nr:unnamed protein product [Dicrocoelium dendriticum]